MMICPKSRGHRRFIVTAHVTEDWIVDGDGSFVELSTKSDCEVVREPSEEDVWTCATCGSEAVRRTELNRQLLRYSIAKSKGGD